MYFCPVDLKTFLSTAITEDGKLQLDFFDSTATSALSSIVGKTVVQKCCDINSVREHDTSYCVEYKRELASQFFQDLLARENETLSFVLVFRYATSCRILHIFDYLPMEVYNLNTQMDKN